MTQFSFQCDEDDARAIHMAAAVFQRRDHESFGETLLPEGESETLGAILGELCRRYLEQVGAWPGFGDPE